MYVYVVEYLGARVAFKTVSEAEKYVELMYGTYEDRAVRPTIEPCLFVEDGNE